MSPSGTPAGAGSRRRRLWELPADCHGPLLGVCLPVAELRRMMDKVFGGESRFDDFHLHQGAVLQCTTRNKVSEPLQRELDRRHSSSLRCFDKAKSPEAVAGLWAAAVEGGEFAPALWAALTHPRCTPELREQMGRDIHMLRYEIAASVQADLANADRLLTQNKALSAEQARLAERHARWQAERQAEREQLLADLVRARAEAAAKDSIIAKLREGPGATDTAQPARGLRQPLLQRLRDLKDRLASTQHELAVQRRENTRLQAALSLATLCMEPLAGCLGGGAERTEAAERAAAEWTTERAAEQAGAALQSRIVLCVGGRTGHIPLYRELVERHGGRFLHHDGGIEDNAHRLDAQLTAADMVVCQTAFLGHNAYGRVKEHCKRTGKRCVYVDKPGTLSFLNGLAQVPAPQGAATTLSHAAS